MRLKMFFVPALIALSMAAMPVAAKAAIGTSVIVNSTSDVMAEFLGSTAAYDSVLILDSTVPATGGLPSPTIFHNHLSSVGDTVNLGSFPIGTELIFRIDVLTTGDTFYTGPAGRNPDSIAHANIVDDFPTVGKTYVGFEDLLGGGDLDYDDLAFAFTNVRDSGEVPEPTSLLIWGAIAGVGLVAYRRRRTA